MDANTMRDRYTFVSRHDACGDNPVECRLTLKIGNQSFRIGADYEDIEHANWMARQLGVALKKLLDAEIPGLAHRSHWEDDECTSVVDAIASVAQGLFAVAQAIDRLRLCAPEKIKSESTP